MALSATISVNPSSATFNEPVTALVTISNSGASNVTLSTLQPIVQASGSSVSNINSGLALSAPPSPTLPLITVPASGSVVVPFSLEAFSPSSPGSSSISYSVSCNIITSDGSSFAPGSPATLTVSTSLVVG